MIVLDASAVVEMLRGTPTGEQVALRAEREMGGRHVPHLVDVELARVLRRCVRRGQLTAGEAETAMRLWRMLPMQRHSHLPLLDRAWELRENLSVYDGVYVALAEALGAPLLTCDRRLANAPGPRCGMELIDAVNDWT